MPRHVIVHTLQELSLKAIGALVVSLAPPIASKPLNDLEFQKIESCLNQRIENLKEFLTNNVPYHLYNIVATEVLICIKNLVEINQKYKYPDDRGASFVLNLIEVVLSSHLKEINFSRWPKMMVNFLYKNVSKMVGLEKLDLGGSHIRRNMPEYDKRLGESIARMKHLQSLHISDSCTDHIIQVIAENCPTIQCLDVSSSHAVTDHSIPSLLKCTQLKKLILTWTSITPTGLARILRGLVKLQDVGRFRDFGGVVEALHQSGECGPFFLRRVYAKELSRQNLMLLVEMFPKIEHIRLEGNNKERIDLTILSSLDCLMGLEVTSWAFYRDHLKQLLEVRGSNITSLSLEKVEEIDLDALVDISQFCPKLKILSLYNCHFMNSHLLNFRSKWKVHPFQSLEALSWHIDGVNPYLEFLLSHAVNIRSIHVSNPGITHSWISKVFNVNPMKQLREMIILNGFEMNMRTVELLLASCPDIWLLKVGLENMPGITREELETFRQYIDKNNFNLIVW